MRMTPAVTTIRSFRLVVRPRAAPGIVFFLGLGNTLERFVVGLLVDLRLLLLGFLVVAVWPPHLGVCRRSRQCQRERHYRQGFHVGHSPPSSVGNLLRSTTMAKGALPKTGPAISNY